MQNLSLLFEICLEKNLISFFLCFAENNSTAMSTSVEIDNISNNSISMIVRTIEGQMLDGLGCPNLLVLDEVDEFAIWGQISS